MPVAFFAVKSVLLTEELHSPKSTSSYQEFSMSADETYILAHTAQCKLKMAADKPDRNLRFILGHAFTVDKLMCRIVEIENDLERMPKQDHQGPAERRVSFKDNSNQPTGPLRQELNPSTKKGAKGARAPSPPPDPDAAHLGDSSDSESDPFEDDEDADDPSLSLSRTTSNVARPPPSLVPSDGDSSDEDDGPDSPPARPSDSMLATITEEEEGDEMLADLYETVRKCGCQAHVDKQAPPVAKVWELPQAGTKKHGKGMKQIRTAVVQVQA